MAATASGIGAPHYTAKLLTNPRFVKWLSQGVKIAKTKPNDMSVHLGRLYTLREKEDIKDELDILIKQMNSTPPPKPADPLGIRNEIK